LKTKGSPAAVAVSHSAVDKPGRPIGAPGHSYLVIEALRPEQIDYLDRGLKVRIGPVDLKVRCSQPDAEQIVVANYLETALRFQDEQLVLYGFADPERRQLFFDLCSVSGIGPETALLVLDLGVTIDILRAVSGEETEFFSAVPGLGPGRIAKVLALLSGKYHLPDPLPVSVTAWTEAKARHPELDFEALLDDSDVDLFADLIKRSD
jgi:Holliday junction resolvasome RuvABC DNA-binding subunit